MSPDADPKPNPNPNPSPSPSPNLNPNPNPNPNQLSNAAYLLAGFGLLERTVSRGCPPLLGYLMMAACGYSTTYHAMQILFGVRSAAARSTGRLDVILAMSSAVYFFIECGCDTIYMRSLALVSGLMFVDVFQLGYTLSHSLWHLGGAAPT